MGQQAIDYAQLAKEHGAIATVDYAKLAKDAGSTTNAHIRSTRPSWAALVKQLAKGAALPLQASAEALPVAANVATEFATNPQVPLASAKLGRIVGAVAAPAIGAYEGGATGGLAGMIAAAKSSWLGGKTGYFSGKLAQNIAAPIANMLNTAAPYAQTLSTLSGASGVGELAQLVEPTREDIGFLGLGRSVESPGPLNANEVIRIQALMRAGASNHEAVRIVLGSRK